MNYMLKPVRVTIILFTIILFSGACSSKTKKNWNAEEHKVFMQTCVENSSKGLGEEGSTTYCQCMMEKIERIYPNAEDAGKLTMTQTMEMAKGCLKNLPPASDSLNTIDSSNSK